MKLIVDRKIFERFPGLNLGLVAAKGIDNAGKSEEILSMIKEQESRIRQNFSRGTLSENPKISSWRAAYSSFGAKPKKYKCSVENLYRMILDGIELSHINKIVDIYNFISIKHMVPVGGDNTDKVDGDIRLATAKGEERFEELNTGEVKSPKEGEIVYMDSKEVLCRRWNWRECEKSKMTEETRNVALVVEGLPPFTKEEIGNVINELAALVKKHCGGEARTAVLDKSNPESEI